MQNSSTSKWAAIVVAAMCSLAGAAEAVEWTQQAKFTADDGAAYDEFGTSVSLSGDYAIVGALYDDDHGSQSGSAYVFHRDGTSWSQQAKLTAADGAAEDYFGGSVSLSGNYAIVGARGRYYYDDTPGSAYVFHRNGTSWTQQGKLTAWDGAAGDDFGRSVSLSGNYAIAGAWGDDSDGKSSGSAYIFHRDGTSWTQQGKLTASDGAKDDGFGGSVSISGDYAIVGASGNDDDGMRSGSAYIFQRNGAWWGRRGKLTASDGAAEDRFGDSVSLSGDYAIVGASWHDHGPGWSGSAYIFHRDGNTWTEQAELTASDRAMGDRFGSSVSISGDYAIVGAYWEDHNGSESGSAYIFHRDGTSWTELAKLTADDGEPWNYLGYSVSLSGGYAIAGAYGDDDNGFRSGSAYVFVVPEPSTFALLGIAALALLLRACRRKKRPGRCSQQQTE